MPENKSPLVYGLLFLGLILIGISTYYSFFAPKSPNKELRLATVERETGKVFVFRSGFTQKENLLRKADLYHLDSVETMESGEAVITFESAFKVRMMSDTMLTLESVEDPQGYHTNLILKRGDVHVDQTGREGELMIAKNGERIAAADYNNSALAQSPTQPLQPSELYSNPVPADQGLSEEEISTVMNNHRSSFFKCYTQLLQKDPTAKGNVSLSFTIENSGKLSVAEVTASQLQNEDFKKCLLEVLRRIEFRSFKGAPISTLFPLKFE